jgi:hypothetical protein
MENYDINRKGYHDTHGTTANIYLDYGAAVIIIAIEATDGAKTIRCPFACFFMPVAGRPRGCDGERGQERSRGSDE